tara:strand:- start:2191 stop:2874 length:684 start_codon:yes stop_codon:yes gene_type:complete
MVKIDNVYQKVLAIINKEQRGYVTPQEFNLFADHAQMDIFEQYFYDINQLSRVPGNDTDYSDIINNLEEKIAIFEKIEQLTIFNDPHYKKPDDVYRVSSLQNITSGEIERVTQKEYLNIQLSPLAKPTIKRPVYTDSAQGFRVYPNIRTPNFLHYIKRPIEPKWGYVVVGEHALYDPDPSVEFELHASEENNLVIKILALAGLSIKDPSVYQSAVGEDNKNIQQEKA